MYIEIIVNLIRFQFQYFNILSEIKKFTNLRKVYSDINLNIPFYSKKILLKLHQ